MRPLTHLFLSSLLCVSVLASPPGDPRHTFALGKSEFLLDGKPFQIIGGEMHPARIPREYWRHRIQMAKAMGCNTIAAYFFWNYHEIAPGRFDFRTGNRDLAVFMRIVQEERMWLLVRPGPYVCAEWDFGGIPSYLLKHPDLKVRCLDPRYMEAAARYVKAMASVVRPFLVTNGGPVLMLQIENEYGSYGNDKEYLETLRRLWKRNGIDVPFFTADGPSPALLEAGNIDGAAIGLDSGSDSAAFAQAALRNPNVPSFSSETYPGWLTHWGETWARPDTADLMNEVRFLLKNRKSFNFYVIHGGTNFGFTAGANSGGKGYEPDVTSYDYDAPINEQGQPTDKYVALRSLLSTERGPLPAPPPAIPTTVIAPIAMRPLTSLWQNLPRPFKSVQPRPMESFDQSHGLILYRTRLVGHKSGRLVITDLHDYGLVFLNGNFVDTLDRRAGKKIIQLPGSDAAFPTLDILVEAMGRINYGSEMIDRKGITDRVTLNGMTLMHWEVYPMPLEDRFVRSLRTPPVDTSRPGIFFRGTFSLDTPADTYFDMSGYAKGMVWVNGHNLGRYWNIGPQKRLYCPAPWLKTGANEIVVLDLLQTAAAPVSGARGLE